MLHFVILKFTYVVSCQIYGQTKQRKAPEAADIALLLQRYQIESPHLLMCYMHIKIETIKIMNFMRTSVGKVA